MKKISKKSKILAMIFSAMVAASACSMTAFAAETKTENPVTYTSSAKELSENNGNYHLTSDPDYFKPTPFGNKKPGDVFDASSKGYTFNGKFKGRGILYTEKLITGKYSYDVTVTCTSNSGTPVTCYAYNASSRDELIGTITVKQGTSGRMKLTGLSKTSKIYLTFTGPSDAGTYTYVSGSIS